jgi:hypothetical protein
MHGIDALLVSSFLVSFREGDPLALPPEFFTLKSIFKKTLIEAHIRPLGVCLAVWYIKLDNKAHTVKFGALLSVLKLIKP